jgi:hypothetical protein
MKRHGRLALSAKKKGLSAHLEKARLGWPYPARLSHNALYR